jgi:hypothetical protein
MAMNLSNFAAGHLAKQIAFASTPLWWLNTVSSIIYHRQLTAAIQTTMRGVTKISRQTFDKNNTTMDGMNQNTSSLGRATAAVASGAAQWEIEEGNTGLALFFSISGT